MGMIIITLDDYESGAQARRALREFMGAEEINVKPVKPVVLDELDGWEPETAKSSPRSEMEAAKEEVKAASAPPPPPPKEESGEDAAPANDDGPVKLDSDGLPWDHRIHASSKKTLKSGQWRKKRGIEDDLVAEVEAELRAAIAAPDAPAPPPPPAADEQTAAAPPPPPPAADEVPHTLADLMKKVTAADLQFAQIQPILQEMGVPSLPALNSRPDLIPAVYERLFAGGN